MGVGNSAGIYFIQSYRHLNHVLACDDEGKIRTTSNKVKEGWEGNQSFSNLLVRLLIIIINLNRMVVGVFGE